MNILPVQALKSSAGILRFLALICLVFSMAALQPVRADIPDRDRSTGSRTNLTGFYKVAASNDPFFPQAADREWFMDFAQGASGGSLSGKVAVSLRQNPHVKVRIMVWQLFPQTGTLVLGNQTHEGSKQAVAMADWKIKTSGSRVILERRGHQIVLQRSEP